MADESKKGSEVLLELSSKIDAVLNIARTQDLNIKILSNKLNEILTKLEKQNSKITVEAIQNSTPTPPMMPPGFSQLPGGDPARNIPIVSENNLPQTDSPNGFRRNSRPETFAGDSAYLKRNKEMVMPLQIPQVPPPPTQIKNEKQNLPAKMAEPPTNTVEGKHFNKNADSQIPVMQRVVDKNGKSIFLADVEVLNLENGETVFKTRTNGTGKWMASLGAGAYRVKIGKRAAMNKEKLESFQDITVSGQESPLTLPMVIIK